MKGLNKGKRWTELFCALCPLFSAEALLGRRARRGPGREYNARGRRWEGKKSEERSSFPLPIVPRAPHSLSLPAPHPARRPNKASAEKRGQRAQKRSVGRFPLCKSAHTVTCGGVRYILPYMAGTAQQHVARWPLRRREALCPLFGHNAPAQFLPL